VVLVGVQRGFGRCATWFRSVCNVVSVGMQRGFCMAGNVVRSIRAVCAGGNLDGSLKSVSGDRDEKKPPRRQGRQESAKES